MFVMWPEERQTATSILLHVSQNMSFLISMTNLHLGLSKNISVARELNTLQVECVCFLHRWSCGLHLQWLHQHGGPATTQLHKADPRWVSICMFGTLPCQPWSWTALVSWWPSSRPVPGPHPISPGILPAALYLCEPPASGPAYQVLGTQYAMSGIRPGKARQVIQYQVLHCLANSSHQSVSGPIKTMVGWEGPRIKKLWVLVRLPRYQ